MVYFSSLASKITSDSRWTRDIKFRISMGKSAFNKKKNLFTSKLVLNFRKKLVKFYSWSVAFYGAGNETVWKIDQKYMESFETCCWRKMEKIIWTDRVRNEMKKYYIESRRREISYKIKGKEG